MKRFLRVFWRMGRAYLFYPVMIALFLWLYIQDAHWIFGVMVIAAILILDPMWRRIGGNAVHMWKSR